MLCDNLLPVPLIDIDAVEIVENFLIPPDSVHISIKTFAGKKTITMECHALPLCKALYYLRL